MTRHHISDCSKTVGEKEEMETVKINTKHRKNQISPDLYGIFFEDLNYAGDGGLYAELVANRSFEYYDREGKTDKSNMCWETVGNADFEIRTEKPLNDVHTHYAAVQGNAEEGIRNLGFCREGVCLLKEKTFHFSCYARADKPVRLKAVLKDSTAVYAQTELQAVTPEWKKYECELSVKGSCQQAYLEILLAEAGSVELEFISLFPASVTPYGLRRDMVEILKELKPRFMRFPGGCIVEGRSFDNMYRWKDTIGPVEERRTNWNRWQVEKYQREGRNADDYFQSYGLGYYEYFLLCEELGAKPLPVMNVGMTCQWHEGLLVELSRLDKWIQDVLDLIEFANGDEKTVWGRKRAELGHKEPFHLEYIGIGNEQWGMEYFERYERFQKVISERYPQIKLITSAGWTSEGEDFDLAVEWMKQNREKAYAVDEHFYKSPQWFLENITRYDSYDRTMPKVFAGEYAAHTQRNMLEKRNNCYTALAEAAFLTGVERNADHVVMACYAPLFGRTNHNQWQPNLIWFDGSSVYGTPNYYVQKLFSNYLGDCNVEFENADGDLQIAASVTADESRLIVKIVNLSEQQKQIELVADRAFGGCEKNILCAPLEAENSHEKPDTVVPRKSLEDSFSGRLELEGNSIAVLQIEI